MTVIATIITSRFTAHAADSFITIRTDEGTYKVQEAQETKIVRVPAWRGAISYWGLATHASDWSTLRWLRERAASAGKYSSAEDFVRTLARDLTTVLRSRRFQNPLQGGIGMHFSAYEWVEGCWVPELFHIRNWENESYSGVQKEIVLTRETIRSQSGNKRPFRSRQRSCSALGCSQGSPGRLDAHLQQWRSSLFQSYRS